MPRIPPTTDPPGAATMRFFACVLPCAVLLVTGCLGPAADTKEAPKEIQADWGQSSPSTSKPATTPPASSAPASSDKLASSNQERKQRMDAAAADAAQPTRRADDGGWSEYKEPPSGSTTSARMSPQASAEAAAEAERRKAELLKRVIALAEPSLVTVKARKTAAAEVVGSGFVASQGGIVVANYHTIDGAESAEVVLNGQATPVLGCIGFAPAQDLVLLRISASDELRPLRIAEKVEQSEPAAAFSGPEVSPPTATSFTLGAPRAGSAIRNLIEYAPDKAFDMDAFWVQIPVASGWTTTAAGGPLLNLMGEVVAFPTSFRMTGQNMGLAISAENIGALVREAGKRVLPLAQLPKTNTEFSSTPGAQKLTVPFIQVELPSGVRLSDDQVAIPADWKQTLFPSEVDVYLSKDAKGAVQGVYAFDAGKLDGMTASLAADGKLKSLGTYKAARRNGPLRLWNDEGQLVLHADYRSGNKQGVTALFRDGKPWIVQEWAANKLVSEALVHFAAGIPDTAAPKALSTQQQPEFDSAQAQLAAIEKDYGERERIVKQELLKWYREEDEKLKKERVSQLAPMRRQRMLERQRAAQAAASAAIDSAQQGAAAQNYQRNNAANTSVRTQP